MSDVELKISAHLYLMWMISGTCEINMDYPREDVVHLHDTSNRQQTKESQIWWFVAA